MDNEARVREKVANGRTESESPGNQQGKWYEIRVEGELPNAWSSWFEGMRVRSEQPGESIISGILKDQAALHGVLAKIRDLPKADFSQPTLERSPSISTGS